MPTLPPFRPFDTNRIPLEQQYRPWDEQVQPPYDRDRVDPYTRARVILMAAIEQDNWLFLHEWHRDAPDDTVRGLIAELRRAEAQQQTTVAWLSPADQSVAETAVAYEQAAVDLTANLARNEPDPYVRQALDYALIEDADHLFRFAHLLQMLEGRSAEAVVKGRTEIAEGRPTPGQHHHPLDLLRRHVEGGRAEVKTRLNLETIIAAERQAYLYYSWHGLGHGDDLARRLFAEIAEVEEEHLTQYESLPDPSVTWLERAALKQVNEAYNYFCCWQTESDARLGAIWEGFYRRELEHIRQVGQLLQQHEGRDVRTLFPEEISPPVVFEPNREYVRQIVSTQRNLQPVHMELVPRPQLPRDWASFRYAETVNRGGIPSQEIVERVAMPA